MKTNQVTHTTTHVEPRKEAIVTRGDGAPFTGHGTCERALILIIIVLIITMIIAIIITTMMTIIITIIE